MFLARFFLLLAITTEVAGTSSMNIAGQSGAWLGYLAMYVLISLSYYFLSLAIRHISVGVAYAIWEGLGIALISVASIFFFGSELNLQQLVGLAMVVGGIVMVTAGEEHAPSEHAQPIQSTNAEAC